MKRMKHSLIFFLAIGVTALIPCDATGGELGDSIMETRTFSGTSDTKHDSGSAPKGKPNRLIQEKSPYLLQHAYNPVDWHPWGEEAFEKAKREDKPIFLSIGYSTCHWCHVMEHESFEDPEVAELMNDTWVSIKVDREERPDIDHLYMTVCQMMTGGGGWPLNILMTPDKKPFFAATYIPKQTRFGRMGMLDLTRRIKEIWEHRKDEALASADKVIAALKQVPDEAPGEAPGKDTLDTAYRQLTERFDAREGGFSNAPKFPTPHNVLFLMRYWKRTGQTEALKMVEKTVQAMRLGGIYDHVGFGFHRYSTDSAWLVPHFEKMLYDQAMLAMAYTEAYQATGKEEYANTVREILTYVMRDMTAPGGGFYSAEDADSEGEEGKFYVWKKDEIREVLGPEEADLIFKVYNVNPEGNFHDEASGTITGTNILHLKKPIGSISADLKLSEADLKTRLESAREKLFAHREKRIHPHKDDKILTDWNGLMIAAMAKAAQALDEPKYAAAADKAADFIFSTLRDSRGRLLHRFRDGEAGLPVHVDDYAFLIWGLLELHEATQDTGRLNAAIDLNKELVDRFWDDEAGGFYFTSDDSTELPVRKKEIYDGATPSGNSVAALNLLRLGRITGNSETEELADKVGRTFAGSVSQFPSAYTQLLMAIEFGLGPSHEVVIVGDRDAEDTKKMLKELGNSFVPNKVVLFRPAGEDSPEISKLAEYTKHHVSMDGKATAYVCRNYQCELPTTDPGRMMELLGAKNP
jgi:uncharacterized protein